ncbi:MAG: DUF4337 domain-containing protein [Phycisphaerae bacterium]|nr:DUF4337 domain-containing protein [Phycisphaerae bacterium]
MFRTTPNPASQLPPADPSRKWTGWVAIATATLAALASVSSLLATRHTTEAMIDQISASDQWSYYQAKSVKEAIVRGKMDQLAALGKEPTQADRETVARYEREQNEITAAAKSLQVSADDHRRRSALLANAATLTQIAIALCAISLLTRRSWFLIAALLAGAGGTVFLVVGLVSAGPARLY